MKKKILISGKWILTLSLVIFFGHHASAQETLAFFIDANGKYGLKNKSGQIIVPGKYDFVYDFNQGLASVKSANKWGFIDVTGKQVIPLKYDSVGGFQKGKAFVQDNKKWGAIDTKGNVFIPLKYDGISSLDKSNLFMIKLNDKWGYLDANGKGITPIKYMEPHSFSQGLARVNVDGKWGFMDSSGKEIIAPIYETVKIFEHGRAFVRQNKKWGAIDLKGKEIIPTKYDSIAVFNNEFTKVRLNTKWGLVDKTAREVIPLKYNDIVIATFEQPDELFETETEWYSVRLKPGDSWKLIDKSGKELTFDEYSPNGFSENLLAVGTFYGKWGYIDKKGNEIIPRKYDEAHDFGAGRAMVKLNDKWGYIDKTGIEIIPIKYEEITSIQNFDLKGPSLKTKLKGKWGLLDKSGKEIIPPEYDDLGYVSEGLIAAKLNGKWGYANMKGELVILPQYDEAFIFNNGTASVKKDGKQFTIDNPLRNSNGAQTAGTGTKTNESVIPLIPAPLITQPTNLPKPPTTMRGGIDASLAGLWTATYPNGQKVFFDFKANGMYVYYTGDYSPGNAYNHKCYWRIDGTFIETYCEGATQVDRSSFKKGYDTASKPTLKIDQIVFIPADKKTSW